MSWLFSEKKCPAVVPNAILNNCDRKLGSKCQYSCAAGFLATYESVVCLSNSEWHVDPKSFCQSMKAFYHFIVLNVFPSLLNNVTIYESSITKQEKPSLRRVIIHICQLDNSLKNCSVPQRCSFVFVEHGHFDIDVLRSGT